MGGHAVKINQSIHSQLATLCYINLLFDFLLKKKEKKKAVLVIRETKMLFIRSRPLSLK